MGLDSLFGIKETTLQGSDDGRFYGCFNCQLYKNSKNARMEPYGLFEKEIMLIGEYPTIKDDNSGRPWSGQSGRILKEYLHELGIDLYIDCITINAVACVPFDNQTNRIRRATGIEIKSCRKRIFQQINEYKPKIIFLLGELALLSVFGNRWKKGSFEIAKWIGGSNVKYYLQNFRPEKTIDPEFEKVKPFPKEFLEAIIKDISPSFKICELR